MLFQPENQDFILYIIKEVELYEDRSYWTLMKNIEVKNKNKNKYGSSIIFYLFDILSEMDSQMEYE